MEDRRKPEEQKLDQLAPLPANLETYIEPMTDERAREFKNISESPEQVVRELSYLRAPKIHDFLTYYRSSDHYNVLAKKSFRQMENWEVLCYVLTRKADGEIFSLSVSLSKRLDEVMRLTEEFKMLRPAMQKNFNIMLAHLNLLEFELEHPPSYLKEAGSQILSDSKRTFAFLLSKRINKIFLNLSGAQLSYIDHTFFHRVGKTSHLIGIDLSGANLERCFLLGIDLSHSNFSGARLDNADLREVILDGSNLSQTSLTKTDLRGATFEDSILVYANLEGSSFGFSDMSGANLTESDFSNATLEKVNLSHANLTGAKLNGMKLKNCDLTGAILLSIKNPSLMETQELFNQIKDQLDNLAKQIKGPEEEKFHAAIVANIKSIIKSILNNQNEADYKKQFAIINKLIEELIKPEHPHPAHAIFARSTPSRLTAVIMRTAGISHDTTSQKALIKFRDKIAKKRPIDDAEIIDHSPTNGKK